MAIVIMIIIYAYVCVSLSLSETSSRPAIACVLSPLSFVT